ncbi:hypothetical protein N9J26_01455 [bacterium]|nr:hypothetical protein [bacterium]
MHAFILSQTGVYRLQQLANSVREKTGVRHKLSDPKSVISLLRYSSTCTDRSIRSSFASFTDELTNEHRDYLANRGLLIAAKRAYQDTARVHQLSFG